MYFFYIDESGTRDPEVLKVKADGSTQPKEHLYVLTAVSLFEWRWRRFESEISSPPCCQAGYKFEVRLGEPYRADMQHPTKSNMDIPLNHFKFFCSLSSCCVSRHFPRPVGKTHSPPRWSEAWALGASRSLAASGLIGPSLFFQSTANKETQNKESQYVDYQQHALFYLYLENGVFAEYRRFP